MSSEELKKYFEDAYDNLDDQIKRILTEDIESKNGNVITRMEESKELNWDVFICHASEDKADIVEPLAKCLRSYGVKVWYDDFTLKVGDSISRSIDMGLSKSKQGIIVISKDFIRKSEGWPGHELGGMRAKKMKEKTKIIPIWHGVDEDDIIEYSPSLLDIKAINSKRIKLKEICLSVIEVVRPDIYENIHRIDSFKKMIKETKPELIPINDLKSGPIRHKELPKTLTTRINMIFKTLSEVQLGTIDEFTDAFKRDIDPNTEIEIWERIAIQYHAVTNKRELSINKKKEIFAMLLQTSLGFDLNKFKFKYLTKEDISNISEDISELKL
ncbi:toll/interleukin-1 receptor domain-containing protein [Methanobacterium spitsbergense]|uniref:Toll/interleukin-1 receptor domain-containing protein n=1 Tax=Methanobacterium spitsbergense TaxID=2874285 RepID=A0A8T5UUF9_9EURY|nr:toll/interleukin-1 receptor domain-containing protein [Methanobacterium spitsbergense]MBZ2164493.1 toll/interleukin-1 receptor domain-containing protein [Methanobacterium spitsbergense]